MKEEYDNYDKWFEKKPEPVEQPKPKAKTLDEIFRPKPTPSNSWDITEVGSVAWICAFCSG